MLISRVNFDLPGTDVLLEDPETLRVRQGNTMNKGIIATTNVIRNLIETKSDYVVYENSYCSHLMKETLGGNSLALGIFCIQQGDMKGSALALRYMQLVRKIVNFPVLNDNKTFGLLKKFRSEAIMAQNN